MQRECKALAVMNGTVVLPIHEYSLPHHKTAGCLLRESRELKGLSQEAVASSLNLMLSHVVAMESDAYNPHIEGRHFASYLKSYARLVDLNPQILLGLYQGQTVMPMQAYATAPSAAKRSNGMSVRVVTVIALIGVALLFTRQGIDVKELPQKGQQWAAQIIQATLAAKPAFTEGAADSDNNVSMSSDPVNGWRQLETELNADNSEANTMSLQREVTDAEVAASVSSKNLASAPGENSSTDASTAVAGTFNQTGNSDQPSNIVVTPSDGTYQAYRLEVLDEAVNAGASGADVLQFTFVGNCWIEVYDSNQNPIVMETKLEGELLRISGEAPFEVRVGNSRAVSLLLNGEPVHIEQHPTIDSTELIVGRR